MRCVSSKTGFKRTLANPADVSSIDASWLDDNEVPRAISIACRIKSTTNPYSSTHPSPDHRKCFANDRKDHCLKIPTRALAIIKSSGGKTSITTKPATIASATIAPATAFILVFC